jgi:hypothetical protein
MDFESDSLEPLPKQRQRYPITYLIVHKDADTGEIVIHEAEHRKAAKKYINGIKNPETIEFIYRVSGKISLQRKVVMSF